MVGFCSRGRRGPSTSTPHPRAGQPNPQGGRAPYTLFGLPNPRQPASKDTGGRLARFAVARWPCTTWVLARSPPAPCAPSALVQLSRGRGRSSRNMHRTPGGPADTWVRPTGPVARTRTGLPHKLPGDFAVVDHALSSEAPAHGPPRKAPGSGPRGGLELASSFACSAGALTFMAGFRAASECTCSEVPLRVPGGERFPGCSR